ncbi:MAG TPA: DUF4271 domain-containing protein [Bacteroidales bacterium]|nr:DUF4271 domain-containing protein [Bacteroidales bacterium]
MQDTSFFVSFIQKQDECFFLPLHNKDSSSNDLITQTRYLDNNKNTNSIFKYHSYQPKNNTPVIRQQNNAEPLFYLSIILFLFTIASYIKHFFSKRLIMISKAFIGNRFVNQLIREGNLFSDKITPPLILIFLINSTLTIWLILRHFHPDIPHINDYTTFAFILISIFIYYILQTNITLFIGNLFKSKQIAYQINLLTLIGNIVLGICLLPIVPFLIYYNNNSLFYLPIILISIIIIWRIIRIINLFINNPKFYTLYLFLFLYLCNLEIIPLLIVLKLLTLMIKQ